MVTPKYAFKNQKMGANDLDEVAPNAGLDRGIISMVFRVTLPCLGLGHMDRKLD